MYRTAAYRECFRFVNDHVGDQAQFTGDVSVDEVVPGVQGVQGADQGDHLLSYGAGIGRRQGHGGPRTLLTLTLICKQRPQSSQINNMRERWYVLVKA